MTKPTDDLEAVRVVVEALQGFDARDQERVIRWAREKLGLVASSAPQIPASSEQKPAPAAVALSTTPAATPTVKDLAIVKHPMVDVPQAEGSEVEHAVVEQLEVEQVEPAEKQSEAVNMLMPAPEQKNRAFLVIGIILMAVAVGLLILMIVSHGK